MIDELRAMAIFATVAETGSFSAAGRKLGLATSVISHHVSRLEERLGAALLYRSTRALSLTGDGHNLLEAAQRMISAAEDGLNRIADVSDEPSGALRLTMPAFVMNSVYEAAVWQFAARYPRVAMSLHSTDRMVDLVGEGYDLAIRLGNMKASALMSRKIGSFERRLVAAPSYLATIDPVIEIADLTRCDFVSIERLPDGITLIRGTETVDFIPERSRVQVNSVGAARSAVMAGLGLQRLPVTEIAADLAAGRLVQVLGEWRLPDLGVYAVWPETGKRSALTRRLVDHLAAS